MQFSQVELVETRILQVLIQVCVDHTMCRCTVYSLWSTGADFIQNLHRYSKYYY